jgi:hypothetical protein
MGGMKRVEAGPVECVAGVFEQCMVFLDSKSSNIFPTGFSHHLRSLCSVSQCHVPSVALGA